MLYSYTSAQKQNKKNLVFGTRWELNPDRGICIPRQVPLYHGPIKKFKQKFISTDSVNKSKKLFGREVSQIFKSNFKA